MKLTSSLQAPLAGEPSLRSKAELIDALQRGPSTHEDEERILDVFLGTHGAELTALKNAVDAGGDSHDLQELVWHDIDDEAIRRALLAHLAKEARVPAKEVKVISDIDDTFLSSLKDERFPRDTVYPGIRQLYA